MLEERSCVVIEWTHGRGRSGVWSFAPSPLGIVALNARGKELFIQKLYRIRVMGECHHQSPFFFNVANIFSFFLIFIVIQLQLYAFSPHPSIKVL